MITAYRQLAIRTKAIELLNEYKISIKKPVSTTQLILKLKNKEIYHIESDLKGIHGLSCWVGDLKKYLIMTDKKANVFKERYRFTVCHEIGHIILKHLRCETCSCLINDDDLEREADIFAEEILMSTIRIIHMGYQTIKELKENFNVSNKAAANKLKYFEQNTIFLDYMNQFEYVNYLEKRRLAGKVNF